MYDEGKRWSSKCPECGSKIVWSMTNRSYGSSSSARCSKSPLSSVITKDIRSLRFCDWVGRAFRQKDGSVRIKNKNGAWISQIFME
jgi:hypothetical protein